MCSHTHTLDPYTQSCQSRCKHVHETEVKDQTEGLLVMSMVSPLTQFTIMAQDFKGLTANPLQSIMVFSVIMVLQHDSVETIQQLLVVMLYGRESVNLFFRSCFFIDLFLFCSFPFFVEIADFSFSL